MYRHSPIRNPRSKGIKTKNVLQVCLLLAVCFWLIFQVKRSHDKKKEFDNTKISLSTTSKQSNDEPVKFGRKDLQPKLDKEVEIHEEQDDEQNEEHLEHDEEKIDEEKEDGGGGGDDEIDENEQEKSDVEVDHEEMEVIDEETHSDTGDHEEEEEEEDGGSMHTHEGREEHYKADDASSAVVTHLATENGTSEEISSGETVNNGTSLIDIHENGPPSNTTITTSDSNQTEGPSKSNSSYVSESNEESNKQEVESNEGENLEGKEEILDPDEVENETHLEEKEVRMDLDTLPEIETEGGNSEDTAVERR